MTTIGDAAARHAGEHVGRVAVHVVGNADLGFRKKDEADAAQVAGRVATLRSRRVGAGADLLSGTPVRRFVDELTASAGGAGGAGGATDGGSRHIDRLLLLATTDGEGATRPIAEALLPHVADLAGDRVWVNVEHLRQPTTTLARAWARGFVEHGDADEHTWLLGLGSGATGIFLGVLYELLIRRLPVEIWPLDTEATETSAPAPIVPVDLRRPPSEEEVRRWLVRHRYYDVLARLEPKTWEPLARRQAVDVAALLTASCGPSPDGSGWLVDDTARAVLTEAVQAAFAEGLARQEITDGAAARTWLRRFVTEHCPPGLVDQVLAGLGVPRRKGRSPQPALDPTLAARTGEPVGSLLRDDVVRWHRMVKANSHGALAVLAEPPSAVVELQNGWIREQHSREPLAAFPAWLVGVPARRARRVVLLRAVSARRDRDAEKNEEGYEATVREIATRLDSTDIIAVELTTPQVVAPSTQGLMRIHRVTASETDVIARPGLAPAYRRKLLERLREVDGAEYADEVVVVLPEGAKALAIAALMAAVDWSLHIAAPLEVLALDGKHGPSGPVATLGVRPDGDRALAALGLDHLLAQLAENALRHLDLTLAARLLARGSARLHGLAEDVRAFQADAFGVLPPSPGSAVGETDRTSAAEVSLATARLRLCAQIVEGHPWDAAYLASSVIDHTFRMPAGEVGACTVPGVGHTVLTENNGWVHEAENPQPAPRPQNWKHLSPWQTVRLLPPENNPSSALRRWRNDHPLSHGLDPAEERPRRRTGNSGVGSRPATIRIPSATEIRGLIRDAERELDAALRATYPPESFPQLYGRQPDELARRHDALVAEAVRLAAPSPAARAANGSSSAAAGTNVPADAGSRADRGEPAAGSDTSGLPSRSSTRSATSTDESK